MPKKNITTPYDVQEVAQAAARTALNEFADSQDRKDELQNLMHDAINGALEKLGVNVNSVESVEKFRANMAHLQSWREFTELVKTQGIGAAVSWITKGCLLLITLGIVALLGKHLSGN